MPYVLITPPAFYGVTIQIIRKYPGSYAKLDGAPQTLIKWRHLTDRRSFIEILLALYREVFQLCLLY
jgi:hypothetical protein